MQTRFAIWSRAMKFQVVAHGVNQHLVAGKFSIAKYTNALVVERLPISKMIVGTQNI